MIFDEVNKIRQQIFTKLPPGSIIPRHDTEGHHYQLDFIAGSPVVDSVTTKGGILDKSYLKNWATGKAIEHIRDNWTKALSSVAEREIVFIEAEHMHTELLDDASDIGTRSHAIVEDYLNDWIKKEERPDSIIAYIPLAEVDTRVISAVRAAEKYCNDNYIIPIYPELLVGSEKYKVAGTLDLLAFKGKERNVCTDIGCPHEFWQTGKAKELKYECIACGQKIQYELTLVDWKSSNSINKPEYMMQTATYWECLKERTGLKPKKIDIVQLTKKNGGYNLLEVSQGKKTKAFEAYKHLTKTYDWLNSEDSKFEKKILNLLKL